MKRTKSQKLTRDDIEHIVFMLLSDDELWCGGIPEFDKELTERYCFTSQQAGNIQSTLYNLITKKMRWDKERD